MHIYIRRTLLILLPLLLIGGAVVGYLAYSSGYFAEDVIFSNDAGAIGGYDPVAYFRNSEATPGSPKIVAEHGGAIWRFSSAENRERFLAEPEKYLPQYGGYCAYAVSEGYTAYSDPTAWQVADGRLFLNYSQAVQAEWETDRSARISLADDHWPQLATGLTRNE